MRREVTYICRSAWPKLTIDSKEMMKTVISLLFDTPCLQSLKYMYFALLCHMYVRADGKEEKTHLLSVLACEHLEQ